MKRLLLMFFSVALIFFACNADPPVKMKFADVTYEQTGETVIDLISLDFEMSAIVPYIEHSYCAWSGGTLMIGYVPSNVIEVRNSSVNEFINNFESLNKEYQSHNLCYGIEIRNRINRVVRSGTKLV